MSLVTAATTSPFFCNATARRYLRCGAVQAQTYVYLRRIPSTCHSANAERLMSALGQ